MSVYAQVVASAVWIPVALGLLIHWADRRRSK